MQEQSHHRPSPLLHQNLISLVFYVHWLFRRTMQVMVRQNQEGNSDVIPLLVLVLPKKCVAISCFQNTLQGLVFNSQKCRDTFVNC